VDAKEKRHVRIAILSLDSSVSKRDQVIREEDKIFNSKATH
jgi:hypothetical protein